VDVCVENSCNKLNGDDGFIIANSASNNSKFCIGQAWRCPGRFKHLEKALNFMNTASSEPLLVDKVLSLRPTSRHLLTVVRGCAWATLVGKLGQDNPDIFLHAGESLVVEAGQHVVLESWTRRVKDELWVAWQIAYDASIDLSKAQGNACLPLAPKLLPAKTT
jgi:hypothetical protein